MQFSVPILFAVFLVCKAGSCRLRIGQFVLRQPVVILGAFDFLKDDPVVEFEPHQRFGDDPQQPLVVIIRQLAGSLVEFVVFLTIIRGKNNFVGRAVLIQQVDYRFDVPYGCLYNTDFPNLLCAGRIVSADGNGAHVLRVVPCCCLTGQAAGIAAAVAIEQNKSVADVYDPVKPRLASSGVAFEIK